MRGTRGARVGAWARRGRKGGGPPSAAALGDECGRFGCSWRESRLVGQRGELGLRAHASPGEVRHGAARRPPQRAVAEHCLGYAPAGGTVVAPAVSLICGKCDRHRHRRSPIVGIVGGRTAAARLREPAAAGTQRAGRWQAGKPSLGGAFRCISHSVRWHVRWRWQQVVGRRQTPAPQPIATTGYEVECPPRSCAQLLGLRRLSGALAAGRAGHGVAGRLLRHAARRAHLSVLGRRQQRRRRHDI